MIVVRLLDAEGRNWGEFSLPDDPRRPRMIVLAVAPPKDLGRYVEWDTDPTAVLMPATIEFRLERQDGGGTFIYRRETPLW